MAWGNAAAWSERVRATRKISPRPSRAMSIAIVGRARVHRRGRISRDDASAAPRAMDDRDDRRASDAMRDGTRGMTREWDDGKCAGSIDRSIEGVRSIARAERAVRTVRDSMGSMGPETPRAEGEGVFGALASESDDE